MYRRAPHSMRARLTRSTYAPPAGFTCTEGVVIPLGVTAPFGRGEGRQGLGGGSRVPGGRILGRMIGHTGVREGNQWRVPRMEAIIYKWVLHVAAHS